MCALPAGRTQAADRPRTHAAAHPAARPCGGLRTPPSRFRHVIWIVLENRSYGQIIGSPDAPYLNALARACGLAADYSAISHPSLPNYIALTSGSTQGIADDDGPAAHRLSAPSIFSQLGGGWRALAESMPAPCDRSDAGAYAVRHNPAVYYTNLGSRCARQDLPLTGRPNFSARFTFVTPNICHDMHDCSTRAGDAWLAGFVPRILRTRAYRRGQSVVFITWDEGSGDNHVATLVLSRFTKPGTVSRKRFDHYSLLRTTEALLGLPPLGQAARAADMRAAFRLR